MHIRFEQALSLMDLVELYFWFS